MRIPKTLLFTILATLVAFPALAENTISGTVVAADDQRMILATHDGLELYELDADVDRPANLAANQVVLVRFQDATTPLVTRVDVVDEQIEVEDRPGAQGAPRYRRQLGR